ncbi:MAG: hypothetical protein ACE5HE_07345 [Phycisphaerae bacterium]
MPWLSKTDAARALGISRRAVTRGLADGMLVARREGPRLLVHIRDDIDPKLPLGTRDPKPDIEPKPPRSSRQSEQPAWTTPSDALPPQLNEQVAGEEAIEAIREARRVMEEAATTARVGAEQVLEAQQRSVRYIRRVGALSIAAAALAAVLAVSAAWTFDRSSATTAQGSAGPAQPAAERPVDHVTVSDFLALKKTLDADRQATAVMLRELGERLTTAHDKSQAAQATHVDADLRALDERVSALASLLSSIEGVLDEITCEWELLREEHAYAHTQQSQLALTLDRLMQELSRNDPSVTLRKVIDKDWNPKQ